MTNLRNAREYSKWLQGIKERIATSRIKAALSANRELIALYWFLGGQIVEKQKTAKWGSSFIEQFSHDLKNEFPEMTGFSSSFFSVLIGVPKGMTSVRPMRFRPSMPGIRAVKKAEQIMSITV